MVDPCWARVCGPLEPYAEGLREELERLGYTPLSAAGHVRLVAHLSRWMIQRSVSVLTPATVDAYFAERRAAGYYNSLTARSLRPLLDYLQELGVVAAPAPVAATSPCERLLSRYHDYLLTERGLATSTVELNVRMVRPFLATQVRADGQLHLEPLSAGEVAAFVVDQSRKRPRSVGRLVTALRSLLRFLHVDGVIDRPLAMAVPSVANWSLSGLPKALNSDQVAALLSSCNRNSSTAAISRSSHCWSGSGCVPGKSPRWRLTILIGAGVRSLCGARLIVTTVCHSRLMLGRQSPIICATPAPPRRMDGRFSSGCRHHTAR